ncbi:hypothetical protein, partial [Actinacidiphila bryophytorum]|uniref:hypothetical protein n=1 Tax=Actinacidiphila bryophytorum TaxID=1436133 RepID=UPI001980797B
MPAEHRAYGAPPSAAAVHDRRREGPAHPPRSRDLLPEPPAELLVLGVRAAHELDRDLPPR